MSLGCVLSAFLIVAIGFLFLLLLAGASFGTLDVHYALLGLLGLGVLSVVAALWFICTRPPAPPR